MKFFLTNIFLLLSITVFAQKYNVSGHITDSKQTKLAGITVKIKASKGGTVSNQDGFFSIANIEKGEYILEVSGVGYEKLFHPVKIDGANISISLQLNEASTELQTVEITGRKETEYKNSATFIGSKSATALKDLPQSISYVTKELIQDQAAFRVNDVVKNMSGVSQFTFYNDLTIRGHRVSGNDNYSMLVNGMRAFTSFWKQQLIPHIERVEVIKGPSSALFGNAAAGGSLNRVTKKPLDEKRQSFNISMGSFANFRTTADFTGPMNEEKTLLYRLNVGYENSGSFRDLQFEKNYIIAPSFSFLPNHKTRINFDIVLQNGDSRLDRGQSVLGTGDLYSTPISKSLNRSNDYLKENVYNATVSLNHKFSNRISFNSSFMRTSYDEDLLEHRSANTYAKDAAGKLIDSQVEMQVFIRKRTFNVDNVSNYFNIDVDLGKTAHKLVIGYDYAQEVLAAGGSQLTARGYRNATNTGSINTYDATKKANYLLDAAGNPVPNVAHYDLKATNPYFLADMSKYFYQRTDYPSTFYSTQGIYLQDQITYKNLQVLLGLRQDYFTDLENYNTSTENKVTQKALIPRVGLVYTLNNHINAYGTFVKGYQPQTSTAVSNVNAGGPFDPLYSTLYEVGAKTDWFDKRLTANVSIYQLTVDGALYNAGVSGQPDLLTQVGREVSKGIEFDIIGQLATNWNLIINYSYNDATFTQSKDETLIGRQKPNAPKHQGNIWTKYVISKGNLSGLGIGLGTNFATERLGSIVAAGAAPQAIPAYQLLTGAIYYKVGKCQLQLNANNLSNTTYWVGGYDKIRMFPGSPRTWMLSINYAI
ncbi:iron complex outermembrane receptor protein [Arcicella aurantiaca]|uniref:Iron complex outermembrane receptor protein n=1 Tax=Arcicella aurantiaca TaxID=591202 RepID=A0A316DRE9_9BACT|nr:TonB-dependent receptor [Arcicella aurantiaca]PWK20058.1 iron complex outermembrane receptor protein [Arcicella aurantiaca]